MQIEKYTDRLKTLIQSAQTLALRSGHQQFTPLHVLKALIDDEDRLAAHLIEAAGGNAGQVRNKILLLVRLCGSWARHGCEQDPDEQSHECQPTLVTNSAKCSHISSSIS